MWGPPTFVQLEANTALVSVGHPQALLQEKTGTGPPPLHPAVTVPRLHVYVKSVAARPVVFTSTV